MPGSILYDVILTGYRNDLARLRVLQVLGEPVTVAATEPLPRVLYRALTEIEAEAQRRKLVALGAQISIVATGLSLDIPATGVSTKSVRRWHPWPVVLLVIIGLVAYWNRTSLRAEPKHLEIVRPPRTIRQDIVRTDTAYTAPAGATLPFVDLPSVADPRATQLNNDAVALAHRGEYEAAATKLQTAHSLAPQDTQITHNLQAVFVSWGVEALNHNNLPEAVEPLEQALEYGEHVEALYGLGIAHLKQSDLTGAQSYLDRAYAIAPKDARVLLALAEIYQQQDRRADALDMLYRAREAGFGAPDLKRRMEQLGREVDAEWDFVEHTTPHFRISFADTQDPRAIHIVRQTLEDAYDAVTSRFHDYPEDRIAVVLYTQQDFHGITQTPDWAGGAFDGRIKLPVRGLDATGGMQLARVIRHELAHALIHRLTQDRCPAWLNEGLAVWAEETADGDRIRWARTIVGERPYFRFAQLAQPFARFGSADAELAYAQSYLAVRQLVERYHARSIPDLLRALRTQTLEQAFNQVYRDDFGLFEEMFTRERGRAG